MPSVKSLIGIVEVFEVMIVDFLQESLSFL